LRARSRAKLAESGSSAAPGVHAGDRFSYENPYSAGLRLVSLFYGGLATYSLWSSFKAIHSAMSFHSNDERHLRELEERLGRARAITPRLMADAIARACPRLQVQHPTVRARVARLIESGAFAVAILALLELELPQWTLRRLIYEDGEWHCSLSKHVGLPAHLDEPAEGSHESLPLAILSAFVEARRNSLIAAQSRPHSVPLLRHQEGYAMCCDNFA